MKKIKTVVVCGVQVPYLYGGAEVLVDCLNKELNKRGFQSTIVNLPFKWYPTSTIISHALAWRMLDLTESNGMKVDRVICTKFPSYVVKHPNKVTWLVHQHRSAYDLFGTKYSDFKQNNEDLITRQQIFNLDTRTIGESKKIFSISQNVSTRLLEFNGLESTPLYPPPKNIENYYNREYGDYILYVGRLDTIKRVDLLINSLILTESEIKCIITGNGPDEKRLKNLVNGLKLNDRVLFKGYVADEELIEIYANCFAVFYAPVDEDYGFATVEAFKSGKPVVTTSDSGGVLEFVTNDKTGYICDVSLDSIAKAINELYKNKSLCSRMGTEAQEKVKNLNWDEVIEKLTAQY